MPDTCAHCGTEYPLTDHGWLTAGPTATADTDPKFCSQACLRTELARNSRAHLRLVHPDPTDTTPENPT